MTREEIIKRGGTVLNKKNQETADALDRMDLSEKAQDLIAQTDINIMYALFGELEAEEVEKVVDQLLAD